MARTYTISGALITVGGDPFEEGRDDFLEFDLVDEDGDAIADASVDTITATLRTKPHTGLGSIINGREGQSVKAGNGGSLSSGTFRLSLSGSADLVAVGSLDMQARELTIMVTLTDGKQIPTIVHFLLRPHQDVPVPTQP